MTRLPIVLSGLALIVAIIAAVGAFRDKPTEVAGMDEASVVALVDGKIKAMADEMAAAPATPADDSATAEAPALDPDAIGPIVRDYMVAHPEILEDVMVALEEKRERDQVVAQSEALEQNREAIFNSRNSAVVGNPAGDVTLVEFFDYNCGYCKRMLPALVDLLESDPNLRVVFKEWPVLTDGSGEAARVALGVLKVAPEKYLDFHVELMSQPGGSDGIGKKRALKVVEDLGIDLAAVEAAAKDPAVDEQIAENYKIAEDLGLRGTPSYVVGEEVIPGAVSFETLREKIDTAREAACQTC
jgi:protein-disulfide isomerase